MIEEATSSKHSDTTDAPLVSVVAPCFNAEKYLEEALRSIYEQGRRQKLSATPDLS
ncbi:hypothetical protein ACTTYI_006782, partial [Pseudomonas aeruginosa]